MRLLLTALAAACLAQTASAAGHSSGSGTNVVHTTRTVLTCTNVFVGGSGYCIGGKIYILR